MIPRKKKICLGCKKPKIIFADGKCRGCCASKYSNNRKKNRATKFGGATALADFYQEAIEKLTGVCECCKLSYEPAYHIGLHAHVAHILPKGIFPEIATHPDNWFEASWLHHTLFDSTPDLFLDKFKNIIPELRRRFDRFKHLIHPDNISKIPYFLSHENI